MEAYHNANCTDIHVGNLIIKDKVFTILTHHWLQKRYHFIPLHQYLHENKGQFKFLQSSNLMHHWLQIRYHFIPFHLKRESRRAFWKNRKFFYNSFQRILIVDKMCWNCVILDPTSDGIVFTMTLGSHKASLIDTSAILNLFFGARRLQRVRRATDIVSLSNAPKLCY